MKTYHVTVRMDGVRSTWTVIARGPSLAINAVAKCLARDDGNMPSCALIAKLAQ